MRLLGMWDFKRLVAYSSVNHMGFVVLGLAVFAFAYGRADQFVDPKITTDAITAANGAVFQMFNHGLSAAGMFFLVGVIYERTHTRDLKAVWRNLVSSASVWWHLNLHLYGFLGTAGT